MSGSPTTQQFSVLWPTNFPATVVVSNDVLNVFNGMPQSVLNGATQAALSASFFTNQGYDVTSTTVSNSVWVSYGGNIALQFSMTTISDPLTASDVVAAMAIAGAVMITALTAAGLLDGIAPGLLVLGLVAIGVLAFVEPIVTAVATTVNTALTWLLPVIVVIGGGIVTFALLTSPETRKSATKAVNRGFKKLAAA